MGLEASEEGKMFFKRFFSLRLQGYEALLNTNKIWNDAQVEKSVSRCRDPWSKGIREILMEVGVLPPCEEISSPISIPP